jgi:crotonobetainyl-CoA:carnitine CoA-transferase CaiB-like acyl-CoA transferase
MLPLADVRILAVEQYGAGPFGTQALADLGAEVIKIENPRDGGDVTRGLGPHFDPGLGETAESLFFQALNRNKRSVALDLAAPQGQAVFRALVRGVDAVAGNLRGDVPARLGLTYAELSEVNPAIVCCHLSAYGRSGSRAAWPGYDYLVQAEAGYFALNGDPSAPPSRFGLSIVDFMTGYAQALALLAGVLEARRTGTGRDIDVCLYDIGLANLNYLAAWALNAGADPQRLARSAHPSLVPCQLFPTADGWIFIMANKEKFFPALCAALEAPELAADPRFAGFPERLANRAALEAALDSLFSRRSTADWVTRLAGTVPAAPVATMAEALASTFTAERGMVVAAQAEAGGTVRLVGSPFETGDKRGSVVAAPTLGRDTDAVLDAAGYGAEARAALRAQGVIA